MWHLDEMISPIIKEGIQELTKNEIVMMERIRKQKVDLINRIITPAEVEIVRQEIVDSWVRCINYGLDPFAFNYGPILEKSEFEQLEAEKNFFIRSAQPYMDQLQRMLANNNYLIMLTDENGTILRIATGNTNILKQITDRFRLMPGTVWTEDTVGTCPHIMSLMLHSPFQLCGPEFYSETNSHIMGLLLGSSYNPNRSDMLSDAVSQTSSSSAPIFDAYQNLAGSITIISPYLHYQNSHSLGLTVSTAWAIQNQLQLALHSELLSVTLEAADEAVITVNKKGIVTKTNMRGQKAFSYRENLIGAHIEEILGPQLLIEKVMASGQAVNDVIINLPGRGSNVVLKSAQPVKDQYGTILGCVLTFSETRKVKNFPVHRSGFEATAVFNDILGESVSLKESLYAAKRYARSGSNILIQGESGTGKELFAQAIHNESRARGPFVAINCAAIPITLIESELFGYEAGAFTGAERKGRAGKIELANEGTLFLDEIGDMPLELQPVLLRVLEEKKIIRIGANQYTPVDFSLITATNKNLLELVRKNRFRADLYYRLSVLKVRIPPLRERGLDIICLAKNFIEKAARRQHALPPELSDKAALKLLEYDWPGNVRELENAMVYAVNMSRDGIIGPEALPQEVTANANPHQRQSSGIEEERGNKNQEISVKEMEKLLIMQALHKSNHNVYEAADHLGISPSTLYRKIKRYDLTEEIKGKKRTW